ncbi:peptidoglycan DD-metalloendopeptidase family protein [Lysinibacillus xylanilyticus]|uniref:peptidoglycan DD-metalloendopeptidase family protein n=1 Tax=Lysinibacillus xylanilyticus TaxID=582475 RepID=UPI003D05154B
MSTGGGQTKPTELLIALGINDEISKKNINTYIQRLKNIPNLTINLDVKGHNTQIFIEYEKQIKALERQLEAFNQKIKNIGSGASPTLSFFDEFKQQVTHSVKSIDALNKNFGDLKINVNAFYKQLAKVPTGDLHSLEKLLTQLKTEMETVNIHQFKLNGIQETQQNLQALEANLNNIYELQKAYADTADFEQLISQIAELNTQITNIQLGEGLNIAGISEISNQLEKINQDIIAFGNNTNVAAQNSTNYLTTFIDLLTRANGLTELINTNVSKFKPPKIDEDAQTNDNASDFETTNVSKSKETRKQRNKADNTKTSEKAAAKIAEEASSKKGGGLAVAGGLATIGRGLLASTGIGAGLVAAEFVIKQIQESKAKAKQMAAELEAEQKNIVESYADNAPDIESLTSRYAELEKSIALGNTDPSILTEYQEIANQLGEMLPHIVAREDEFGNKIIGSSEALKVKIELLKEQQAIESQIAEKAAKEKRDEDVKIRKKSISNLEDEYDSKISSAARSLAQKAQSPLTTESVKFYDDHFKPLLKTPEDFDNKFKDIKKLQSDANKNGNNYLEDHYKNLSDAVKHHKEEIIKTEKELNLSVLAQKDDYISNIADVISENERLTESVKNNAEGFAAQLIAATDASDLDTLQESLTSLFSNEGASTLINDVIGSFQNMENATSETFDSMASKAKDKLSNVKAELSGLGLSEEEVSSIMKALNQQFKDTTKIQKELSFEMNTHNLTLAEAREKVGGYKKEAETLSTVYEKLAGVSQKKINDTSELLFQYEMLTNQLSGYTEEEIRNFSQKGSLTAEEQRLVDVLKSRDSVMNSLNSIYPSILDKDGKAITLSEEKIKVIQAENRANEVLLKAYKLAREEKLTSEQQMMIASAQSTKFKIENIKNEILMLENYVKANEITSKVFNALHSPVGIALTVQQIATQNVISGYKKELSGLVSKLDTEIGVIDGFTSSIDSSSKSSSKASKASNSAVKESIYVTDNYKKTLENLNLEIQKQISLQSTLPKHSNEYKKSLEQQLKLEKDKLEIIQKQARSIQSQIESGKVQKTGNITSNGTTSTTTKKLSGWSGKITSPFGGRIDPISGNPDKHLGMDISAKKGTRLESNISGTVIKAGKASKNSEHGTYGNIVIIRDDSGIEHLYAHLNKAVAKVGDYVQAGTYIGETGESGRTNGPHLHYETRKNGKRINPIGFYKDAKSGNISVTTSDISKFDTGQQAIDEARSELINLQRDILNQRESIEKLEKAIIDASLESFEYKKSNYDKFLENSENRLKKLKQSSQEYRNELNRQSQALNDKKKINVTEINQLQQFIKSGKLSSSVIAEYTERLHELGKINSEIDFALLDVDTSKMESYVSLVEELFSSFEDKRKDKDVVLDYEYLKLNELDTSSLKYLQSLEKINQAMREKQTINIQELSDLQKLINSGELYGEALTKVTDKASELKKEIKQLQLDIQEKDYEIIINIKTKSDAAIDDIQFEIDRAEAIRKMYKEGSTDYVKYTKDILKQYEQMAKQHLETRDSLVEELKQRDITAERIKEIKELLEEEHLAYLNTTLSIKDYTKQVEKANESQLEQIANDVISAYKDYIQERRDEHLKLIDEEIKRENEKHEKIMKNLQDELDLFKKNIDERLRLIDRAEAERDYYMEIDQMEKEKNNIQHQINVLALDDSHEAKSKRKKLQEQLDEIDKNINERRHDRDIELQKQGLSDQLELKEEEINGKIEIQEKEHEEIVKKIEQEKEYWEKHYSDLLNDERKFAQMREEILKGNFDKITADFQIFIQQMKDTLPGLQDTMDGTMSAVGTAIRQNVIDQLEEALALFDKFNSSQIASNDFVDNFNPNGNFNVNNGSNVETSRGNLSNADLQVVFGKFLTDKVAGALTGSEKTAAHSLGNSLGLQGRDNGSKIGKNISFDSYVSSLTITDKERLNEFFSQYKGIGGGKYASYIDEFLNTGTIGSPSSSTNNAARYNIGKELTKGDMQVLMAKYMNDILIHQTSNASAKQAIKGTADKIAQAGRTNGSKILPEFGFKEIKSALNSSQISQLKEFMATYIGSISDITLQEYMRKYIASLDSGGFMNWQDVGIDGKGGKAIIAHPNEIILDKVDTNRLFSSINIMDRIMNSIPPLLNALPITSNILSPISNNGDVFEISFMGDIYNTTQSSAKQFAREIMNDIRTRKG